MTRSRPTRQIARGSATAALTTDKIRPKQDLLNLDNYNSEDDDSFDPDEDDEDDHNLDSSEDEDEDEDGDENESAQDLQGSGKDEEVEGDEEEEEEEEEGSSEGNNEDSDDGDHEDEEEDIEIGTSVLPPSPSPSKPTKPPRIHIRTDKPREMKRPIAADGGGADDDDDHDDGDFGSAEESEGGEGGVVKTRAQRAKEAKERVPLASTAAATADVDSLWRSMNQPSWKAPTNVNIDAKPKDKRASPPPIATTATSTTPDHPPPKTSAATASSPASATVPETIVKDGIPNIKISRTYEFAGETHTETKIVPIDSAEGRLFLQQQQQNPTPASTTSSKQASSRPPLRRPLKRTSQFDTGPANVKKAVKINTLEKSRMDWAGFVDKEGIKEDLERANKAGYLDRQAFLGRAEEKRDELWKQGKGRKR